MKVSKLFLISAVLLLAGLATNAGAQPPMGSGIGLSIWAEYFGTNDVAYFAVAGTQLDYFVRVSLNSEQYPIYQGEPNLYLPNGTVIDLANNLALATNTAAVYGPYAYTVSLSNLGSLSGADADEVRAISDVKALSDRPAPASDQEVTASTNWDIIVMQPDIEISKDADPNAFCVGDNPEVTYTYYVYNSGNEDLTDVNVVDDKCLSVDFADPNGDDGDGLLNPGETWIYECIMTLTGTTLNTVDVDAVGYWTGSPVADSNSFEVVTVPPPVVSVIPADATICDANDQEFCAEVTGGIGPFTYHWTVDGNDLPYDTNCITVSAAGVYCVTVIDTATGCDANDCGTLATVPTPGCSIDSGPISLCEEDIGSPVEYCTLTVADAYLWEIIDGNATIDGNDFDPCVNIIPTSLGTIVLQLSTENDVPDDEQDCWNSCQIEILVEECGGTYCTFTQGFWGNAGGKACDGQTTEELIAAALTAAGGTITVGEPGNSITFNSVQCILDSLPAGGKPKAIPAGDWTCATLVNSGLAKKSKPELNNALIGQAVALTLNLLVAEGCVEDAEALGDWTLVAEFCTVPYGEEEACAELSMIPESLVGKTVAELLDAVNAALASGDTDEISDAYKAASAINEAFDECRTVVPCIRPEICGNGCDDDGDELVDLDDPDCWPS